MRRLFAVSEEVTSKEAAIERRRARRFAVDWEVVVRAKDAFGSNVDESGTLRNLSSRGALLSLHRNLRVGSRLELWIRMPSVPERWMTYSAEIVRIDHGWWGVGTATKFLTTRPRLHSTSLARPAAKLEILRRR